MTAPGRTDDQRPTDPRRTIADQMAAQLAASDKAYAKRAAAAARLDALLSERAA